MVFSLSVIPPLLLSLFYADGEAVHFALSFLLIHITGLLLWLPAREKIGEFRDAMVIIVTLFWVVLSLLSAIPFMIGPHLTFIDAFFEAVSGFTTTGATVIIGPTPCPFVALSTTVAIAMARWNGADRARRRDHADARYRRALCIAPAPGSDEGRETASRETARSLWLIYVGLTIACALRLLGGRHEPVRCNRSQLPTVSTGGFRHMTPASAISTAWPWELIAIVFMLAGGINFAIHYRAAASLSLRSYWRDEEVPSFLLFIIGAYMSSSH